MPELAELTGIGESTLYDYESGRTSPTLRALEKIAKAMGVRICIQNRIVRKIEEISQMFRISPDIRNS